MLYTKRGDSGTTQLLDTPRGERVSKTLERIEALGALDELNSYLGFCRAVAQDVQDQAIVLALQHDLFTLQAQIAGDDTRLPAGRVQEIEQATDTIEATLAPIKSFCVPGQTKLSACFDVARTLARRAERRVIAAIALDQLSQADTMLPYLNRLSSLLYALARQANARVKVAELAPHYHRPGTAA